jgi:hypothetical protein
LQAEIVRPFLGTAALFRGAATDDRRLRENPARREISFSALSFAFILSQ